MVLMGDQSGGADTDNLAGSDPSSPPMDPTLILVIASQKTNMSANMSTAVLLSSVKQSNCGQLKLVLNMHMCKYLVFLVYKVVVYSFCA